MSVSVCVCAIFIENFDQFKIEIKRWNHPLFFWKKKKVSIGWSIIAIKWFPLKRAKKTKSEGKESKRKTIKRLDSIGSLFKNRYFICWFISLQASFFLLCMTSIPENACFIEHLWTFFLLVFSPISLVNMLAWTIIFDWNSSWKAAANKIKQDAWSRIYQLPKIYPSRLPLFSLSLSINRFIWFSSLHTIYFQITFQHSLQMDINEIHFRSNDICIHIHLSMRRKRTYAFSTS